MKRKKQVNRRHLKYLINFVDIGPNFFYLFAFSLFFDNDTSFIFFSPHMAMSLDFLRYLNFGDSFAVEPSYSLG